MIAAEPFVVRRLRTLEREYGLAIRAYLEQRERPPAALVGQHNVVWRALLAAKHKEAATFGEAMTPNRSRDE